MSSETVKEITNIAEFVDATEKEQWEFISLYLLLFIGKKFRNHKESIEKLDFLELDILSKLQVGWRFYVHLHEGEDTRTAYISANGGALKKDE